MSKRKLRPVLDGKFWMIGGNPDLGGLQGNTDPARGAVQECVDHPGVELRAGGFLYFVDGRLDR